MRHEIVDCLDLAMGKPYLFQILKEKVLDFLKNEDQLKDIEYEVENSMDRKTEIPCLPLQDTFWSLTEVPLEQGLSGFRMLVLTDTGTSKSFTIQFSLKQAAQVAYEDQLKQLVYHGCLCPVDGRKSRRPRFLFLNISNGSRGGIDTESQNLGIKVCTTMTSMEEPDALQKNNKETSYFRQCSVCGISGTPEFFDDCDNCGAVLYCGEKCKSDDWEESHQDWCSKFKDFMNMETELAKLPFEFASETTGREFCEQRRKEFLPKLGVIDQAQWCLKYQPSEENIQERNVNVHTSFGLGEDTSLLKICPPPLEKSLSGWKDYYSFRGFLSDSLIAVLLHFPLTLYYIIVQLLPKDFPDTFATVQRSKHVCVHVIGAEKEVEMLYPFLECARLLAPLSLDAHFFGVEFNEIHISQESQMENLHFQIHRGLYHEANHEGIPPPSLAVCFNGGIGAYTTYIKTIKLLMRKKTPLYYTDYGQACVMFSTHTIANSKTGHVSPPLINPFRCPLRLMASDQNLPRYSNAFITNIKPFSCSGGN